MMRMERMTAMETWRDKRAVFGVKKKTKKGMGGGDIKKRMADEKRGDETLLQYIQKTAQAKCIKGYGNTKIKTLPTCIIRGS